LSLCSALWLSTLSQNFNPLQTTPHSFVVPVSIESLFSIVAFHFVSEL
jgi:hypothetical protein